MQLLKADERHESPQVFKPTSMLPTAKDTGLSKHVISEADKAVREHRLPVQDKVLTPLRAQRKDGDSKPVTAIAPGL